MFGKNTSQVSVNGTAMTRVAAGASSAHRAANPGRRPGPGTAASIKFQTTSQTSPPDMTAGRQWALSDACGRKPPSHRNDAGQPPDPEVQQGEGDTASTGPSRHLAVRSATSMREASSASLLCTLVVFYHLLGFTSSLRADTVAAWRAGLLRCVDIHLAPDLHDVSFGSLYISRSCSQGRRAVTGINDDRGDHLRQDRAAFPRGPAK